MDIYSTRERIRKENINFMNLPLRVTFYARVSTDFNVQLNSLDNQITYYTDFIRKNPNWEYVDGYVDATVIIGLKQNPTHGRRFSPIFFA